MSQAIHERVQHVNAGKFYARATAVVCVAIAFGLALETQQYKEPGELLKLASSFAMACAVALWMYGKPAKSSTPSSDHQ